MKGYRKTAFLLAVIFAITMLVSACGNSSTGNSSSTSGQTINVLLPPWGNFPKSMLAQFKKETGITVHLTTMSWDDIHDKIVTSSAAGVAPADVTEFDWSWIGQFGQAGWYEPLNKYFSSSVINDTKTMPIFKYKGNYLAMPYSNDFRVTYINKSIFNKAGITKMPTTPEELMNDAVQVKNKGVFKYPIGLPLSATEGTATPWYLLTKSFGGDLFDSNFKPEFTDKNSAGYKAMAFIISGLKQQKIIDPAAVSLKDTDVISNFQHGKTAVDLAGWVGNMSLYQNKAKSTVANSAVMIPTPGENGKSRTFGLPEGLGIPKASTHKEAAAKFIQWIIQPKQLTEIYSSLGLLPNRQSVLQELDKEGKLSGGKTVIKVMPTVEPLFKQGAPSWYLKFSTDVSTTINQMASGSMSIDAGLKHIADNVNQINKNN
ncbi:ABC transporter substrate-binding protein [Sporolactobacillus shoreae]|uniref:ABC transporter substrate-binding protein n=1 Tax=Sporolactobacillus shoreae TaxID=1465501 RepID=UPI001432A3D9|nr:extracellular solute-binding protein [Sporolactobacillus shoreae]